MIGPRGGISEGVAVATLPRVVARVPRYDVRGKRQQRSWNPSCDRNRHSDVRQCSEIARFSDQYARALRKRVWNLGTHCGVVLRHFGWL